MQDSLVWIWLLGWITFLAVACYVAGRASRSWVDDDVGIIFFGVLGGAFWPALLALIILATPFIWLYNLGYKSTLKD